MKIAAVSMIKDECDIIELFIRINSAWANHFYVLDNGSTDHTPHILRRLSEEGYPITVVRDASVQYNQGRMTSQLVRTAMKSDSYDFVFPIDGDEFVTDPGMFKDELERTPENRVLELEWMTLVPKHGSVMETEAPLYTGFERRRTEVRRITKVVLPAAIAQNAELGMGNHIAADSKGAPIRPVALSVPLAHVPVRSKDQIVAKTLVGSHKMSIKVGRLKDEVFHWDIIAQFIRGAGFQLTDEQLRDIALSYGWSKGDPKVRETVPMSLGGPSDQLRYAELARVNVASVLDGFIAALCEEIRVGRSSAKLTKRILKRIAGA